MLDLSICEHQEAEVFVLQRDTLFCFSTRAVHLELASDLTAQKFILAFKRFVGHRGVCRKLYSDNATNFHGADHDLASMFVSASQFYKNVATVLENDGTQWRFIPPNAPHYGGLWEAGVRSAKGHLRKIIGEHILTVEELSTVLVEIEACLNSRPISPRTNHIDDLQALTPAHFLIGESSFIIPDEPQTSEPRDHLNRFRLMTWIRNKFWVRWSAEYLQGLQERNKWKKRTRNLEVGQLVVMNDDRYPPAKWPLGRVV